jgi:iron complex transport system substrate-binding protein
MRIVMEELGCCSYRNNMRRTHSWHITIVSFLMALASPAAAAPRHVVSTFLCTDEYVFRLLPRDRIAALSFLAADRHPVVSTIADEVADIPLVHDSAEDVLARNPDVVVMYAGTQARLHAQLKAAGVPIIDAGWSNSLAEIRRDALALGRALGVEARAQALLADMDRRLTSAKPSGSPIRTLIYEPNGYVSSGPVTDEILRRAGLVDIAGEMGMTRSGMIPVEAVVAAPPQLLLLSGADPRPSLANLVQHHPAFATLTQTAIVPVSLKALACPGPWSADVVPALAQAAEAARALARTHDGP